MANHCFTPAEAVKFGFTGKSDEEVLQELALMGDELTNSVRQSKIQAIVYHRKFQEVMTYREKSGRLNPQQGLESMIYADRREIPRVSADGRGYGADMDHKIRAVQNVYQSQLYLMLESLQPRVAGLMTQEKKMTQMVKAVYGETVAPEFAEMAKTWENIIEQLRVRFNRAGGNIDNLDNWLLPQNHDASTIRKEGFEAWYADIEKFSDLEKMGMLDDGVDTLFEMRKVFETLATNGLSKTDVKFAPSAFNSSAKLANSNPFKRFIIFKDADTWLAYQKKYSDKNAYNAMTDHVQQMSQDIALMENFGPNPDLTFESIVKSVQGETARQQLLNGQDVARLASDVENLKRNIDRDESLVGAGETAERKFPLLNSALGANKTVFKNVKKSLTKFDNDFSSAFKKTSKAQDKFNLADGLAKVAVNKRDKLLNDIAVARKPLLKQRERIKTAVAKQNQQNVKLSADLKKSRSILRDTGNIRRKQERIRKKTQFKIDALRNDKLPFKVAFDKANMALDKEKSKFNALIDDAASKKAVFVRLDSVSRAAKVALADAKVARQFATEKVAQNEADLAELTPVVERGKSAKITLAKAQRELVVKDRALDSDRLILAGKAKEKGKKADPKASTVRAENAYADLSGRLDPVNVTFSDISSMLRNFTIATKLQMAVLAAPSDLVLNRLTANYNGFSGMRVIKDAIRMLAQPADALGANKNRALAARLYMNLDFMLDGAHNANRYSDTVGKGWTAKYAEFTLKAGGLNHWTEANKMAFYFNFATALSKKNLSSNKAMMATFSRYGLDEGDLTVIKNTENFVNGGQSFLELRALPAKTAEKVVAMISSEMKKAVLEPDVRVRSAMHQGLQRGTVGGEIVRMGGSLKTFPVSMILNHWARTLHGNGINTGGRLGYAMNLLIGTTVVGAMMVQLSNIFKGNPTASWDSPQLWKEGYVKGGSGSLLADLVMGDFQKYGSIADFAAGPIGGTADNVYRYYADVKKDSLGQDKSLLRSAEDAARKAVGGATGAAPGQFFYSRLILDRVFMDELRRFGDDRYDQKKRERYRKKVDAYEEGRWFK